MQIKLTGYNFYKGNFKFETKKSLQLSFGKKPFLKFDPDNHKTSYSISFKGWTEQEKSSASNIGVLNHQTAFFREPRTDEIVQNYILKKFGNEKHVNIVSGACSTGEEAKSYAMMLDSLGTGLNIYGFDVSVNSVAKAQDNSYRLIKQERSSFLNLSDLDSENILFDGNIYNLSKYQEKCRSKFKKYFLPKGPEYKILADPKAQEDLEKLKKALENEEEVKKLKDLYYKQIGLITKKFPEQASFIENTSFEEAVKSSKEKLEERARIYRTVRDYEARRNSFKNCTFTEGNIVNLENIYKPNSINVLLYRNALYHTLCTSDGMSRYLDKNARTVMNSIAKQMNKILKTDGLVVYGENEHYQGVYANFIKIVMENNGFEQFKTDDNQNISNIWIKVKDVKD